MKKLLLFLLIPTLSFGQGRIWQRCGAPTGTPPSGFASGRDIMADTCNGVNYKYSNAWIVNNGIKKAFKGDPGAQGIQGIPGANGKDGVCPSCPPSGGSLSPFPFIVVVGTGNDDAAINTALAEQRASNKPILISGNVATGEISIPKEQYKGIIQGYGATWTLRGANGLKRTLPSGVTESMEYVRAKFLISGIEFIGTGNQIALDLGASEMNRYQDLKFSYCKTAIHLRFALRTTIDNCEAVTCTNGFIVDIGNWAGASYASANAQSNQTHIMDSRVVYSVPGGSGDVGIGVYGCSGVVIENTIIEGAKYKKAIDKDFKMCGNDKDFTIRNLHIETMYGNTGSGTGEAYIYIRMVGVASIDGIYSQYGGCFIDAAGSPAETTIDIEHISWLVIDKNQKLFNNGGGAKFIFRGNSYQSLLVPDKQTDPTKPNYGGFLSGAELSRLFTGTITTLYTGPTATQPPNTYILQ